MKTILKRNKKISILLGSVFLFATGSASAAINVVEPSVGSKKDQMQQIKEDRKADMQDRICDRMEELGGKIQERLRTRNENQQQNRDKNEVRIQTRMQEQLENIEQRRQLRDQKREEFYLSLQERAQTEEQNAAVSEFKNSIEDAVEIRRAAVDKAVDDFHDGVQQAIDDRNSSVDNLVSDYQKSRERVAAEVKNVCDISSDAVGVRQSLQTKLQKAKDDFKLSKQDIPNVGEKVKELAQIRKEAVRKASEDFVAAVKSAQEKMRSEFQTEVKNTDLEVE